MTSQHQKQLDAVSTILAEVIGEDVKRPGLTDTPARVVESLSFLTSGYDQDPKKILSKTFPNEGGDIYNGVVLLRDIELYSLCEHHLLPFFGRAHVAYIPDDDGEVVGISKLARLVECFSRRLQCQERLTAQIASAISDHLHAKGVSVLVEAVHLCMRMRGISKQNSTMVTHELRGAFLTDERARNEVMHLLRNRN